MLPRRILGIDPGSHHLGIACIEQEGKRLRFLFAETIHAPPRAPLFERLEHLQRRLRERVDELSPHEIVIENLFFGKSARSAFHLGMSRGVAIGACLGRGLPFFEYAPARVKSVVTGSGRADKKQVRKMVGLILGISNELTSDLGFDATDAIAIAVCHAYSRRAIPC